MADFNKPTVTDTYTDVPAQIRDLCADIVKMLDGVSPLNVPDGAYRMQGGHTAANLQRKVAGAWTDVRPYFALGHQTVTKDDITARTNSGWWQTASATKAEGWPEDSNTWYHLLTSTHSNDGNYYSLQLAKSFWGSRAPLFVRQTEGSGTTSWRPLMFADEAVYPDTYYNGGTSTPVAGLDDYHVFPYSGLFYDNRQAPDGHGHVRTTRLDANWMHQEFFPTGNDWAVWFRKRLSGSWGPWHTIFTGSINRWNNSADGYGRLYFSNQSTTYLRGYGTSPLIVRNGADVDMAYFMDDSRLILGAPAGVGITQLRMFPDVSFWAASNTGAWARGVSVVDSASGIAAAGFGWYGNNAAAASFDIGFGSSWWDKTSHEVHWRMDSGGSISHKCSAPTYWWQDTDHRSFAIHVNNNTAYFMRGGVGDTTWTTITDSYGTQRYPVVLDLNNGQFQIAGALYCFSNIQGRDIVATRGDNTGVIYFGGGTGYLYYDGSSYWMPNSTLLVGGLVKGRNGGRGMGQITLSTSAPTGGADGDIHLRY